MAHSTKAALVAEPIAPRLDGGEAVEQASIVAVTCGPARCARQRSSVATSTPRTTATVTAWIRSWALEEYNMCSTVGVRR
jgi:hypothetical protein